MVAYHARVTANFLTRIFICNKVFEKKKITNDPFFMAQFFTVRDLVVERSSQSISVAHLAYEQLENQGLLLAPRYLAVEA